MNANYIFISNWLFLLYQTFFLTSSTSFMKHSLVIWLHLGHLSLATMHLISWAKLANLWQCHSTPWSHGTYWHQNGICQKLDFHYDAEDVLDIAHVIYVATKENGNVQKLAINNGSALTTNKKPFSQKDCCTIFVFCCALNGHISLWSLRIGLNML